MNKVAVFGNSGSGKSTLAKQLVAERQLAHLDLDTLAWKPESPPQREELANSKAKIEAFIAANDSWVIEGCYADLLALIVAQSSEIVFLDLPVTACVANARRRPWEPHKYSSKAAQDGNLDMLVDWIGQYPVRRDDFSRSSHQALFDAYKGEKTLRTSNTSESGSS